MLLSKLLRRELPAEFDRSVSGLALDSRAVRPGEVFVALAGTQTHGSLYETSALQKGAIAVLKEAEVASVESLAGKIPCLGIPNLSQQLGEIAARFFDEPSNKMRVIGVTGTNGKTSVTHAIAYLLQTKADCGLLGTLGYGVYGALESGIHTTPDAIRLQGLLADLLHKSVSQVVMEVSSHALVQGRVNGINFETAVLTNLSRDHLDYHKSMTAYGDAKRRLFSMPNLKNAVINGDDAFGQSVLANLPITVTPLIYSVHDKAADVYAEIRSYNTHGCVLDIHSRWGEGRLHSPWFGEFNVSNVLAALTVLLNLGYSLQELISPLKHLPAVPGRMERFGASHQATVIIDYAHTPDALEKALLALGKHRDGKLWCVFGCGGDRDRGKRKLMGEVAIRYADKVIITDDNPRHEASQAIIEDIMQGIPTPEAVIADRQEAIHYALQQASVDDVVLIAGKGHEDYQEIGNKRFPFSDRDSVSSFLTDN